MEHQYPPYVLYKELFISIVIMNYALEACLQLFHCDLCAAFDL